VSSRTRALAACALAAFTFADTTSVAAATDAAPLILEHLTTGDGLPQANVMSSLQDSQGFVWLGTEDGLVRFDGNNLYRYAHLRTDAKSIPGNYIWEIVEDANHDLWLATKDGGLARWNRASDDFTTYRHDAHDATSLASDAVRAVLVDQRGLVWVGTDAGIDVLDPKTGQIDHLRHRDGEAASLANDLVYSLARAGNGEVWVATESGVDRSQFATKSFVHFGPPKGAPGSLAALDIARVLEDQSGTVWVGTYKNGLYRLDRDGKPLGSFSHDPQTPASLLSNEVRAILEDQSGRLWIGTAEGLELLDRSSGALTHYRHEDANADSLRDSYVMSLYQDSSGLVWIGTRNGGVSRWNPRSWEFGAHHPSWLGNGPVTSFSDATDDRVWVASLDTGLAQFDADSGDARSIDTVLGRTNALGGARVMSLRQDHLGQLWIGTMADGLKKLEADGRLVSIPVGAGNPRGTSAAGIMSILEAKNGQLWIGTFGGGANVLDPATGLVRQLAYGDAAGAISAPAVTSMAEDSRGNIWIGTDGGGLDLARADGTVVKAFRHDPRDATSFPAKSIYTVFVDAQDRVWVGTDGGGLIRVEGGGEAPEQIHFTVRTRAEGMSSDTIYGIEQDAAGNLWLSGNAGLIRLNPTTGAIKAIHREHGLQGEEFSFGAYHRLRDGRLCFGGSLGFNIFNPANLTENRAPPRLALTNIDVLGARMPSATPFYRLAFLPLDYRANIVTLDFGVLDFASTKHNRLAYRIAGLTDDWIDLEGERRITLTNLGAGDHTLEVRAAGSDSEWSATPFELGIHRAPAPWRSPWAYALYAVVALALLFRRLHRQREKFLEMQQARARLETEVQLRTRELTESNRQLAEAARAKSDFLDRMSHELRTPMNGVVGMTELLSRTALSATQSHLTRTIRSSAQILLQIVNDLLDLSKIRAGKVHLERLPIDLGQVLEECTSLFAGAAETKRIELIVCPPARQDRQLRGDPLRVRQILLNLVGNAVKFTTEGEVVVRASIAALADDRATVRISVSDTGIGMDENAVNRIFEPFSQADETTTRRFGGTGLGLAICRELADIMGGTISVESKPQLGSTFSLSLPLTLGPALSMLNEPRLPPRSIQVLSRRPALEESLSAHGALLGLDVVRWRGEDTVVVLDATTHTSELRSMIAGSATTGLIVIATPAEVETNGLRLLLDERRIVLKPVHRIAFREALAAAFGIATGADPLSLPVSDAPPRLNAHALLVEDEPVNAAVAEGYLTALGCTSAWVKSGREAVARAAAERFDLILMDLNMPDMDGFAATTLIRSREVSGRRVPIIALTAHDASNFREKCLQADMDDILSKPYTLEDCAHLLRKWLTPADTQPAAVRAATPASTTATATDSLIRIDATAVGNLQKLRAGVGTDLYSRLVDLFAQSSSDALSELDRTLGASELKAAAGVCHKLASSAANVGALVYGKYVRRLEQLCVANEHANAREVYGHLLAAHAPLLAQLRSLTLKASA
jgi:signal transduction histidine kinase/ligand-binding sensor domain-containing protein/CheY-like chemotaxis protein/HPt (histidine-containing phosphotransfer) domain-containing protein